MVQTTTLMVIGLLAVIAFLLYQLLVTTSSATPEQKVTYNVVDDRTRWLPWEYGYGTSGWPGAFYINRPIPIYDYKPSRPWHPRPPTPPHRPLSPMPRPPSPMPRPPVPSPPHIPSPPRMPSPSPSPSH